MPIIARCIQKAAQPANSEVQPESQSEDDYATQKTEDENKIMYQSSDYEYKKTKPKKTKADMIKEVHDAIKFSESIKVPKSTSKKTIKEINNSIAEIEKLLKAPKKDLKKLVKADKEHIKYHPSKQDFKEMLLDQKIYKRKVKDVTPLVQNYVNHFKAILSENKTKGGAMTKALNKLRKDFYEHAKHSEIDDANTLIKQFRETLPHKETKAKVVKAKKEKAPDNSYKGDKKYKSLTTYVKKHKPHITDTDDIHMIVSELIDKQIPRMSVKILNKIMEELDYDEKDIKGSGFRRHYDDSDTSSGTSSDYE